MAKLSRQQAKRIAKKYIKTLGQKLDVEKAILFGSAARGTGNEHSDIDIIVISHQFKKMDIVKRLVMLARARGDKFLDWPMDILGYTKEEFEQLSRASSMFAEAKKEGIALT